jgi:plastocyanin
VETVDSKTSMKALVVLMAFGLMAVLAACGQVSQPPGSIKVTMTEYKFDPGTASPISVPAGTVVFFLVNTGTVTHDMAIRDSSGHQVAGSDPVSAGDVGVFTVNNLQPGSYTLVCTQAGHEASGMTGTLTVTAAATAPPGASPATSGSPAASASPSS